MIYKLLIKKSVRFKEFKEPVIRLFSWLIIVANYIEHDITITSANDSIHDPEGLHPLDLAIDIRTRDLTPHQIERVVYFLQALDYKNEYDFVFEPEKIHIHCEFDPK